MFRWILCLRRHGMNLVKSCWDVFCVLAGMGYVCSTHVEMHFLSFAGMGSFWQVFMCWQFEMHFKFFLEWYGIVQHWFRYILGICWHTTHVEMHYMFAFLGVVWSTHVKIHFISKLLRGAFGHTSWNKFCVPAGMRWVWSTQVELIFFILVMVCSIQVEIHFCPRWHGSGLVNMCWDKFWVLVGIWWVFTWYGFSQHKLS